MDITGPVAERMLRVAAQVAGSAPSILNTQPWRWRVEGTTLRLWADHSRQLLVADPDGRLLTVSCGAALHHARLVLAVMGREVRVQRLPDPAEPDLLAIIDLAGEYTATSAQRAAYGAVSQRRTDRRAFTADPVEAGDVHALVAVAEDAGAHLYLVHDDDVSELASVATQAGELQLADPAYRRELSAWVTPAVHPTNGAGVPLGTVVAGGPRRVPVRDFAPMGRAGLPVGDHTDVGARYAVVFTDADGPLDWLRCGEALSAVLLTATASGLATAPISDVTETTLTRQRMRRMLAGIGHPQVAIRVGYAPAGRPPASPRRSLRDVLDPTDS
jgi:nitroreductase